MRVYHVFSLILQIPFSLYIHTYSITYCLFYKTLYFLHEVSYKKESRLRNSPPAAGRNMRHISYPPQCDPRGAFLCNWKRSFQLHKKYRLPMVIFKKCFYIFDMFYFHVYNSLRYITFSSFPCYRYIITYFFLIAIRKTII